MLSGRWVSLAVFLLWASQMFSQGPVKNPALACSRAHLSDSVKVNEFIFRTYKDGKSGDTCLSVLNKGTVVFQRTDDNGGGYTLGQKSDSRTKAKSIVNGTDITGRGHPDMIVSEYTGGAHCCLIEYVFELEPTFKLLATVDAADDDLSHFADLDDDGHYYYLTADWTFAYWPMSFAGSPSAPVVLGYVSDDGHGGGYHLALEKMRKPELTPAEYSRQLRKSRETFQDGVWDPASGGEFWGIVMNLIYEDNAQSAWRLVSEAWPKNVPGKDKWTKDFCSILKGSPYYSDLDKPLDGAPAACIDARANISKQ